MAYLGSWAIDDFLTFFCNTHTAATGAATDADAVPSYRIYEDETGTAIATGTMALIDSTNTAGFYSERVQLTTAIGYEKGKQYVIYISATVGAVVGTMHHTFQMEAEVDANTVSATNVSANVTQWLGSAVVTPGTAGVPSVDTLRVGGTVQTARDLGQGIPNAVPGAAGGLFIAGTNAATTITTGLTTTFTGNLTGSVGSVTGAVGSVTGAVGSVTGAVGSVTGNVGGNVIGSVGSVTGLTPTTIAAGVLDEDMTAHQTAGTLGKAIGDPLARTNSLMQSIPDAVSGATGGLFIAGTNAATTITTGLTTTFTGNLTGSVGSVTGAVGSVTGNVGGNVTGSVGTVNGLAADVLTAAATAADFATEINAGMATSTNVSDAQTAILAKLPAALVAGRIDASVGAIATDAVTAAALSDDAIDAVLDEVVEGTTTMRQALRLFLSALASKVSGAGTTTITFRDIGDTKNRIVGTVDSSGNRSSITLDVS